MKIKSSVVLTFLLLLFLFSCSSNECNYTDLTDSYNQVEDFEKFPISGTYRVSSMSTDQSYRPEELSSSTLYILPDSIDESYSQIGGDIYFQKYPVWNVKKQKGELDDFYGSLLISTQDYFISKKFRFHPSFKIKNENVGPRVLKDGICIRIKDGNPIIVVEVIIDLKLDIESGYAYASSSSKPEYYCNYLVYEKASSTIDPDIEKQIQDHLVKSEY